MTTLENLEQQFSRTKARYEDYLAKAQKEEARLQELDTKIKLEKWALVAKELTERQMTLTDFLTELKARKELGHVSGNQSDRKQHENLQE